MDERCSVKMDQRQPLTTADICTRMPRKTEKQCYLESTNYDFIFEQQMKTMNIYEAISCRHWKSRASI